MTLKKSKITFKPKSNYEKFGQKLYFLLVENFPHTYYVGGMVRNILLKRPINDIDLVTDAPPGAVLELLGKHSIAANDSYRRFGVVTATYQRKPVEIATFRNDLAGKGRYPKVTFTKSIRQDSKRRDFTINSLYLSQKKEKILDFHNGLEDLKKQTIKFVGDPEARVKQDPLRIVRALRLHFELGFNFSRPTLKAMQANFGLINTLTQKRLARELDKVRAPRAKTKIKKIISQGAYLT